MEPTKTIAERLEAFRDMHHIPDPLAVSREYTELSALAADVHHLERLRPLQRPQAAQALDLAFALLASTHGDVDRAEVLVNWAMAKRGEAEHYSAHADFFALLARAGDTLEGVMFTKAEADFILQQIDTLRANVAMRSRLWT